MTTRSLSPVAPPFWLAAVLSTSGCATEQEHPSEQLRLLTTASSLADRRCYAWSDLQGGQIAPVTLQRRFLAEFEGHDDDWKNGWSFSYHRPGREEEARTHGKDEQQVYLDPRSHAEGSLATAGGPDPFRVKNGILSIEASRLGGDLPSRHFGKPYASGMLNSRSLFSQRYGYFEMRARLPNGRAMWPAFWLVPTDGPTPPELDIVEVVGSDPGRAHMTVHWDYSDPRTGNAGCKLPLADIGGRFYTYGALWTSTFTTFYIDRKPVAVVRTPVSMNVPMYMLVNLAVGGRWPGYVDEHVAERVSMEIDWIAVYQLDSDGRDGDGRK